jgi:internalin A
MSANELLRLLQVQLERSVPDLSARLRPPVSEQQIQDAETTIGLSWPEDLKELYRWHNGDGSDLAMGLFGVFTWWSLAELLRDWESQAADFDELARDDPYVMEDETQWTDFVIRPWNVAPPTWIPIGKWPNDPVSLVVDIAPGPRGTVGQLLAYCYDDFQSCTRLAYSLNTYLTDLEQGLAKGEIVATQAPASQNWWNWRTKDGQPFRARGYVGNVWHAAGRTGFGGVVI